MRWPILAFLIAFHFCGLGTSAALSETRIALVIGNGKYKHASPLINPVNDANDVAAALRRTGFETIVGLDLDKEGMDRVTIQFARAARNADVAIFYFAGHAMQFNGINYLFPVDATLSDEEALRRMFRVDEISADLQKAKNLRILVLDSCRDNPLAEALKRSIGRTRSAAIQNGLAKMEAPRGMIVAYSTQAGQLAEDGSGRNSPYTTAFLKHIETQEEIGTVFRRITADVYANTQKQQLPELSLSLIGEFHLKGASAAAVSNADDVDALQKKMKQLEDQLKQRAKSGTSADARVASQSAPNSSVPSQALGPPEAKKAAPSSPIPVAGISPSKVSPLEPGARQPGIDIGDLIVQTISDIDDVWYERFKAIDRSYSGPRVRLTRAPIACGSAPPVGVSFYCDTGTQLVINTSQLKKIAAADDCSPDCQLTVVYLISRLTGQHVQNLLGLPKKLASLQKSLKSGTETERLKNLVDYQADCYAGLFFKSQANRRVIFNMSMFIPMLARLNTSSEPGLVQARDTLPAMSEVRRQWFLAGYESASNISTCEDAIR